MDDPHASEKVRLVAERAVRRLSVLEFFILGAAAVLALLAGAVAAFLLDAAFGFPFRLTWAVASLVLFCVPAAVAYMRDKKLEQESVRFTDEAEEGDETESEAGEAWPTRRS